MARITNNHNICYLVLFNRFCMKRNIVKLYNNYYIIKYLIHFNNIFSLIYVIYFNVFSYIIYTYILHTLLYLYTYIYSQ